MMRELCGFLVVYVLFLAVAVIALTPGAVAGVIVYQISHSVGLTVLAAIGGAVAGIFAMAVAAIGTWG